MAMSNGCLTTTTQVTFTPDGIIYVLVEDRDVFDRIPAEATEYAVEESGGALFVKRVEEQSIVIFQHWTASPISWSPAHRKMVRVATGSAEACA